MTWPSDLARRSTNPFSPENMITKNLMDQVLKNDRNRNTRLFERTVPIDDSDDENPTPHSQEYIDKKNYIFSKNFQKKPEKTIIKPDSERSLLLFKHIKNESGMKKPFNFLRHMFSCCCIQ